MINNTLFRIKKNIIESKSIIFIPNFLDKKLLQDLKTKSLKTHKILNCEVLILRNYAVVHNFLGYSQLYTLLIFLELSKITEFYFCGTAGLLNDKNIKEITLFSAKKVGIGVSIETFEQQNLSLNSIKNKEINILPSALSIDIIQRENKAWLNEYEKNYQIVDMELFFLRYYLKKEITNILIATDSIEYDRIRFLSKEKNMLKDKFYKAFKIIEENINEKSSYKS